MEQAWVEAGFFVIADGASPQQARPLLPPAIVTVSACIVDSYPGSWALPWTNTSPDTLAEVQRSLALDDGAFAELCASVRAAFDDGSFGWPNVFASLDAAQDFKRQYLQALVNARVIGLSFTREVAAAFVADQAPSGGLGGSGVWLMLARDLTLRRGGALLGFDTLGADSGGSFHTFSCNGLWEDLHEKLGVSFNEHGLISRYADAVAACDYLNREEVGAEPVSWYPGRIDCYEA